MSEHENDANREGSSGITEQLRQTAQDNIEHHKAHPGAWADNDSQRHSDQLKKKYLHGRR